jgi:hypothetical protein
MDQLDHVREELEALLSSGRGLAERVRGEQLDPRDVNDDYQAWYTQARRLVARVLPDRSREFEEYYRTGSSLDGEPPTIAAILASAAPRRAAGEKREGLAQLFDSGAEQRTFLHLLDMQLAILASGLPTVLPPEGPRDRELDLAHLLLKGGHRRAAGAMAGLALEQHLLAVARRRGVELTPAETGSAVRVSRALRAAGVYGAARNRQIRSLVELSGACLRKQKPSPQRLAWLLAGVDDVLHHVR